MQCPSVTGADLVQLTKALLSELSIVFPSVAFAEP
jgi:hypothetical protein